MKTNLLLFAFSLCSLGVSAQSSESFLINLYGGYTFSDRVEFDNSLCKSRGRI